LPLLPVRQSSLYHNLVQCGGTLCGNVSAAKCFPTTPPQFSAMWRHTSCSTFAACGSNARYTTMDELARMAR
ncbi:MAG: hypothetical protein M3Z24_16405, partial [Chloroflexota bacterium]|nr:hypothetical protein [Chloroflexota bacterium]